MCNLYASSDVCNMPEGIPSSSPKAPSICACRVWIMSVVATIMAFVYSFIGLGMSIGMATGRSRGLLPSAAGHEPMCFCGRCARASLRTGSHASASSQHVCRHHHIVMAGLQLSACLLQSTLMAQALQTGCGMARPRPPRPGESFRHAPRHTPTEHDPFARLPWSQTYQPSLQCAVLPTLHLLWCEGKHTVPALPAA